MGMSTFFSGFFDKKLILLHLHKTFVLLKGRSYPHNSQVFMWIMGITSENNAILPFFCNFDVENDFYRVFHFFTIYYKFVHFAYSQFFSLLSCLEDSSYCHNTCIGSRRNSNPMRRILGVDNLSISRVNTYMAIIANDISRLCLRIGYCVSRTSLC